MHEAIARVLRAHPDVSLTDLTIQVNKTKGVRNTQSYTGNYSRTQVEKAVPYARTLITPDASLDN